MNIKGLFISIVLFSGLFIGGFLTLVISGTLRALAPEAIAVPKTVFKSDVSSIQKILQLKVPSSGAPVTRWQDFFQTVKSLKIRDKNGRIASGLHSTSPKLGLLAIMAERAPAEFIRLVENKKLSQYAFSHFLKSGLLHDWASYSKDPERIMLENSQALYVAVLNNVEQTGLRRKIADAFLAHSGPLKLDLSSLAFALPAIDSNEVEQVLSKLLSEGVSYDSRSVIKLAPTKLFSPSQLAELVDHQANSRKAMSSYQFDSTKWGEQKYLKTMALDVTSNAKQPMNFYCALCTLAAFTDGLVAQNLSSAAESGTLGVSLVNDTWVFESKEIAE